MFIPEEYSKAGLNILQEVPLLTSAPGQPGVVQFPTDLRADSAIFRPGSRPHDGWRNQGPVTLEGLGTLI